MSFWKRLRERVAGPAEPTEAKAEAPSPPSTPSAEVPTQDPLASLRAFAQPGGASEADALLELARARGSLGESAVLLALLEAGDRLSDPLRVAVAEVLCLRGEDPRALEQLLPVRSSGGLLLQADLHAGRGDYPSALGAIERVLARDLGAPGARERHARWAALSGALVRPVRHLDEPTLLAPEPSGTNFRITREVARGGAGTVYEATDDVLGRKVAFKVSHRGADDGAMLEREVRLAARFRGRGVVRVYDASPKQGWVAFEWVDQGSLREWLRSGRADELWPVGRWAIPLARVLGRVHDAGWVHADIKPANVLLRAVDEPILTDFGIARPRGSELSGGSLGYMSPERLAGGGAAESEDMYGFGRLIEDVVEATGNEPAPALVALLTRCLGPEAGRPTSVATLLELLQRAS